MTPQVTEFNLDRSPQCHSSPKAEIAVVGDLLLKISVVMSADRRTIYLRLVVEMTPWHKGRRSPLVIGLPEANKFVLTGIFGSCLLPSDF